MKKTGAWLVRYALEQIGVEYTFGIPGVHNTELYDEMSLSSQITPVLVSHECGGAFMAEALSRTGSSIGTMLIVPAAGASHAASGIGEAYLDGIPLLVISGGVRSDSQFDFQLHQMDQLAMMRPITKAVYKLEKHSDIVETIFAAYNIATSGEPGPVFIEVPLNIQLDKGVIEGLPKYQRPVAESNIDQDAVERAADLLAAAAHPALFLGWGARHSCEQTQEIAEMLSAPVSTTLQGLSVFAHNHPLHTGMGFGPAAVPAAKNAVAQCDCMLAVGTRFGEIATGSFGISAPANLIHIDINPRVFNANYPAEVCIEGDAQEVLILLHEALKKRHIFNKDSAQIQSQIKRDKDAYKREWLAHNKADKVNPAKFFNELRRQLADDAYIVADDGNHTFLVAELMPIHHVNRAICPTDYNSMGYCVPAVIGTKIANPDKTVCGIVGDGAFMMTGMEIITATRLNLGAIFTVFSDGELSQISQAQLLPYGRKTCSVLNDKFKAEGVAMATGAEYIRIDNNSQIEAAIAAALVLAAENKAVVLDVNIDYSKKTSFTKGIIKTNLKRFVPSTRVRFIARALKRKISG